MNHDDWSVKLPEWLLCDSMQGDEYVFHCWAPRFIARALQPHGSSWKVGDLLWIDSCPEPDRVNSLCLAGGAFWQKMYADAAALHELPPEEQLRRLQRRKPLSETGDEDAQNHQA